DFVDRPGAEGVADEDRRCTGAHLKSDSGQADSGQQTEDDAGRFDVCYPLSAVRCLLSLQGRIDMKRLLLALALALPMYADDGAAILAKVDAARNPLNSFSIDVSLTSITATDTESSKFR